MGWAEGDLDLDGVRIHYYRRGAGRPLILAHGRSDNGECWTPLAEALEGEWDIVAYDARYHGFSDAVEGDPRGGRDLVGVVEALDLERPAALGHSKGGWAVMAATAARPELFACAILEDPPLWMGETPALPAGRMQMPDYATMSLEEIEAQGRAMSPTWPNGEFAPWARAKKQFRPPSGAAMLPPGDWRDDVSRMALPTLLIQGGSRERFAIVSDEVAAEARRLNPRFETLKLAQAGHNIRREAFPAFVEAVRTFLGRHP